MSSPNILLTRIDNRLVHGQVGVTWTSTIGANLLSWMMLSLTMIFNRN